MDPSAAAAVAAAQQQAMQQQQQQAPLPSNTDAGSTPAAANMAQQQAMWPGTTWPNAAGMGMGWGGWPMAGAHASMQMPGIEGMPGPPGAPGTSPADPNLKGTNE